MKIRAVCAKCGVYTINAAGENWETFDDCETLVCPKCAKVHRENESLRERFWEIVLKQ